MPTKAELEAENAALERKVGRLEKKLAEETRVPEEAGLPPPSPSDTGVLYVESHPILGVISKATMTNPSIGDGRIGDGATIVRERHA